LVLLRQNHGLIPSRFLPKDKGKKQSAASLKDSGNEAFSQGAWQRAIDCYTDALAVVGSADDLRRSLHRNRAGALLRLGRYELCIEDANDSLLPGDNLPGAAKEKNAKAIYRAGKAWYELGDFVQAHRNFKKALRLDPTNKVLQVDLARAQQRLVEVESGEYDFLAMFKSATNQHTLLDHASFLKNTRVSPASDGHGRGLFATKNLNPGDVVFVEKAFLAIHSDADGPDIAPLFNVHANQLSVGSHAALFRGLVDKLQWNPKLAAGYLNLCDGGNFDQHAKVPVIDKEVVLDTFQVQAIAQRNGFECPRVSSLDNKERQKLGPGNDRIEGSMGVWLRASYVNHSCLPNIKRAFIGDMMIVRAVRKIRIGDELLMSYTDPRDPFELEKRRQYLQQVYGFECRCLLCVAEGQVPKSTVAERTRLREEIIKFENDPKNLQLSTMESTLVRARDLRDRMRATYPDALFGNGLPRLGSVKIGLWTGCCSSTTPPDVGQLSEVFAQFTDVLRDMGLGMTIDIDPARSGGRIRDNLIRRDYLVPVDQIMIAAMYIWRECLGSQSLKQLGRDMKEFARSMYTIIYGIDFGFDEDIESFI
jgi:tetratricopeptide (TPR) repeat protein